MFWFWPHKHTSTNLIGATTCRDCGATWDADDTPPSDCVPLNPAIDVSSDGLKASDPFFDNAPVHLGLLDDMEHELKVSSDKPYVSVTNREMLQRFTLVEFAELKGYKLGPWMKQQLQEIDEAGARGLSDKG